MIHFNPVSPLEYLQVLAKKLESEDENDHKFTKENLPKAIYSCSLPILQQAFETMEKTEILSYQVLARYGFSLMNNQPFSFPYKIKEKEGLIRPKIYFPQKKIPLPFAKKQVKPGFVVNLPVVFNRGQDANQKKIEEIFNKLRDESFGQTSSESLEEAFQHLRVVVGGNRFRSLDKKINQVFKRFIQGFSSENGLIKSLFGFLWEPKWCKEENIFSKEKWLTQTKKIPFKTVRTYYTYLKHLDETLAENLRKLIEEPEEGINDRVPYQAIRELTKNSSETHLSTISLSQNPRSIYLSIMDPDFLSLRNDGFGLFTHYQKLIENYLFQHHILPTVVSTGYQANDDQSPVVRLGVRIDQFVRQALVLTLPFAPYIPEPNFLILMVKGKGTVEETFINKKSKNKESRQIVCNVERQRKLYFPVQIVFQTLGAIKMTIPDRFLNKKNQGIKKIDKKNLGQKQVLESLRGIRQSHINPLWGFAMNVENALSKKGFEIRQKITLIFHAFDPIYLALNFEQGNYSIKSFHKMMEIYPIWKNFLMTEMSLFQKDHEKKEAFLYSALEKCQKALCCSRTEKANLFALFSSCLSNLIESYHSLLELGLQKKEIDSLLQGAHDAGYAMYHVFEEIESGKTVY